MARLQAWFADLDQELEAVLTAIPESDFSTKTVDRGDGFTPPLGGQFHIFREATLIFCAKVSVYLRAMGRPLNAAVAGLDRLTAPQALDAASRKVSS